MTFRTTRIIFLLLILSGSLYSQSRLLYDNRTDGVYDFRYSTSGDPDLNNLLGFISQARGGRPGTYVQFSLKYQRHEKIIRENSEKISVRVQHTDLELNGDLSYRGFDFSDILFPNEIRYTVSVSDIGTVSKINKFKDDVNINGNSSGESVNYFNDNTDRNFHLEFSEISFLLSKQAKQRVEERINTVNGYYASDVILTRESALLESVNTADFSGLEAGNATLQLVDNSLRNMEEKNFPGKLGLASFDPIHFTERTARLKTELASKQEIYHDALARIYIYHYNNGLRLRSQQRTNQAREAFRQSLTSNPGFAPAAYQLADMDLEEGSLREASDGIAAILNHMDPDPDTRKLSIVLGEKIYNRFLDKAGDELRAARYDQSLEYLNRAKHFCREVEGLSCDDRLKEMFRNTGNAIYQDYLEQARKAFASNDLDRTEALIRKAMNFRQEHKDDIASGSDAEQMMKAVKQERYYALLGDAKEMINADNFRGALNVLDRAVNMQSEFNLVKAEGFDSLAEAAAKPMILSACRNAIQKADSNDLRAAGDFLSDADEMINRYSLSDDPEIAQLFIQVRQKIGFRQCENVRQELNDINKNVKANLATHDYLRVDELALSAEQLQQNHPDCSLQIDPLMAVRDSILPAVVYQKLLLQVLNMQTTGRKEDAVRKYMEGGTYFGQFSLERFGLSHDSITEFAIKRCNNYFLVFLADRMTGNEQYDNSLSLFRELVSRNWSASKYKDELLRLGTRLGIRDRKINPTGEWKNQVLQYTRGDKRLKYLEKGYKSGWRKGN